MIKYKEPVYISEITKHKGAIKPYFGRGTGAGEIHCCKCNNCVGNLIEVEENYVVGWLDVICDNCNESIDYSMVNSLTLNYNVIPSWICQNRSDRKEKVKLCRDIKNKYIGSLMEYYGNKKYLYIPPYEINP